MEAQHPNKDPLKIVGRVIGYDSDLTRRFTVEVFSHPTLHVVDDDETLEKKQIIGECYRYSVKMNYEKGGRKVVTCIVNSTDITDNDFSNNRLMLKVLKYLEHTAEETQAVQVDDRRIDWGADNSCA